MLRNTSLVRRGRSRRAGTLPSADTPWFDRLRASAEREATSPADVVPAIFDAVVDCITLDERRGDGFICVALGLPFDHRSRPQTPEHSRVIEAYFATSLAIAGVRCPREAAAEAYVLLVGSIAAAATRDSASHARRAADSIRRLVAGGGDPRTVSP